MIEEELIRIGLTLDDLPLLNVDPFESEPDDDSGNWLLNYCEKGRNDFCLMNSDQDVYPDYAVMFNEPWKYTYTDKTMLSWFREDSKITKDLITAIKNKDELTLRYFKYKYNKFQFYCPQDFSIYGYADLISNMNQIRDITLTFLFFLFEMDGITFPLATWGNEISFDYCFDCIKEGSNVVISLFGSQKKNIPIKVSRQAIKLLIDTKHPKALLVFSIAKDEYTMDILSYAVECGTKIIILNNTFKESHGN